MIFSPIQIANLEISNRIAVAPMCQYSADNGSMTDWHIMHLGQFAVSGVGLIFTEAVGVEMEGRISPGCLSLCSDEQEESFKRVIKFCYDFGNAKMGIQLAHAGRKASTELPWLGGKPISSLEVRGWKTQAPSAIPLPSQTPHSSSTEVPPQTPAQSTSTVQLPSQSKFASA